MAYIVGVGPNQGALAQWLLINCVQKRNLRVIFIPDVDFACDYACKSLLWVQILCRLVKSKLIIGLLAQLLVVISKIQHAEDYFNFRVE